GPEILHHDVRLCDQPPEGGKPLRRFQVERHAAFVALKILEVGAFARAARPLAFGQMRRRLYLDDIGAPVAELPHAGRARTDAGEIEDGKTGKGLGSSGKRHVELAPTSVFTSLGRLFGADIPRYPTNCLLHPGHSAARRPCGPRRLERRSWMTSALFIIWPDNGPSCLEKPSGTCHMTAADERPISG